MATAIRIFYRLSEVGQRNSLKAGGDGMPIQSVAIKHGEPGYEIAVDMATLGYKDGPEINATESLSKSTSGGVKYVGAIEYDAPPTVEQLLADELRRRDELAKKVEAAEEEALAERLAEAVAYADGAAEELITLCLNDYQVKDRAKALAAELADEVPGLVEKIEYAQAIADEKNAERKAKAEQEKAEKAAAAQRAEEEKAAWIEAHGSNRLRRMAQEGIECGAVYRDERLALDRPGWRWLDDVPGENKDPRNVPEEAFAVLDEARKIDAEAELEYWVVKHECDESCYGDDCPAYDWTGYVATARFLDEWIMLGGPQE